uniref:Uncharacterized protein n=1 Tax=Sphaerodactylus townsendi TaxID=933632 RepID=A0ACB8GCX0_9SAUR
MSTVSQDTQMFHVEYPARFLGVSSRPVHNAVTNSASVTTSHRNYKENKVTATAAAATRRSSGFKKGPQEWSVIPRSLAEEKEMAAKWTLIVLAVPFDGVPQFHPDDPEKPNPWQTPAAFRPACKKQGRRNGPRPGRTTAALVMDAPAAPKEQMPHPRRLSRREGEQTAEKLPAAAREIRRSTPAPAAALPPDHGSSEGDGKVKVLHPPPPTRQLPH